MRVMLIFPPQFDATMPNLALPCLASVLRSAGHEVVLKDVNVESYEHLLTETALKRAFELICERRKHFIFSGTSPHEFERLVNKRNVLFENIEWAKGVFRDKEAFYNTEKYKEAFELITDSFKFLSLAYYRTELSQNQYRTNYSHESTGQIMEAVKEEANTTNLYIDYFKHYTIPDIIKHSPRVVGISITASSQMIPALTLASMIKKEIENVHVVVGGNHITSLKDKLADNYKLFSLFDSAIVHEGETAILKLVESIDKGSPLDCVPNLIYKDENGKIKANGCKVEDIHKLLTPDFKGLPLELYFSPETVIPIYSSRGCYWKKCTFCNFTKATGMQYRSHCAERIVEDIKKLSMELNAANFLFIDEALTPKFLNELSDELIQSGLKVNWFSQSKFEEKLDQELCNKIAKSGCSFLAFGLESACDRVLGKMEKGTNKKLIRETLKNSSNAGIANHIYFFSGFPTETFEEAMETIDFIIENVNYIQSMASSVFVLQNNSYVYSHLDEFNITGVSQRQNYDLSISFDYEVESGLTQQEALRFRKKSLEIMSKYNYRFYGYRILLYSKKFGSKGLIKLKILDKLNSV
ncbi:MAG: cobalamin-dependent protein [Clostridia bacterium]|nr:cobalamin-dependent protein [Clostridia bacterium]